MCACVRVCADVAGTKMQHSVLFSLKINFLIWLSSQCIRVPQRSQLHCLQGSNVRAKILLQIMQQMEFIMLSRLGDPYAVSFLRVNL